MKKKGLLIFIMICNLLWAGKLDPKYLQTGVFYNWGVFQLEDEFGDPIERYTMFNIG